MFTEKDEANETMSIVKRRSHTVTIGPADGARPREVLISSLDEISGDMTDDLG